MAIPSEQPPRTSEHAVDFGVRAQIEGDDRRLIVGSGAHRFVDHDPNTPAVLIGKRGVARDARAIRRDLSESVFRRPVLTGGGAFGA